MDTVVYMTEVIMKRECDDGNNLQDGELEQLIAKSIENHPRFLRALVAIEVKHGYATLTGIVESERARATADFLARARGAIGVNNRLLLESEIGARAV